MFNTRSAAVLKKFNNLKVLMVEDQPEIRSYLREVLIECGVTQVFEAADGRAAMEFIDADFDMINFIICDWNLPHMNGVDFLRQIRSVYPDMPFLMVTGRSDKKSVVEAKSAGVTAYIRKPFSPEQLEEKLLYMVANPSDAV